MTGLVATPTEYGFALKWDANPTADLSRYVVYAGDILESDDERVCSVSAVEYLSATTTSYDYATHPDGEERCMFVDAVDDNGNSHWKWTGTPDIVTVTELDTTPSVTTPEGTAVAADGTESLPAGDWTVRAPNS